MSPMVKMPVSTSFCGWLVLRRHSIGIGFVYILSAQISSPPGFLPRDYSPRYLSTHQSQKHEIGSRIDRAGYEKIKFHVDTPAAQFGGELASQRVPKSVNGYALEDRDEDAGDGEAYDKVESPEENAAELDNGEDAVLEEDAGGAFC